jgi:hypothetical protein
MKIKNLRSIRGAPDPLILAIRARFGRETDDDNRPIFLCGCRQHVARVGALCRSCAVKWQTGGWDALPFDRNGNLRSPGGGA